ncbi:MAG: hypothetical protein Q9162_005829 [Coniocarpon cinnabarinum]
MGAMRVPCVHSTLALLYLVFSLFSDLVTAVTEPLTIEGTKFFYPNGSQFFVKGVVYSSDLNPATDTNTGTQDAGVDVLADITACARDAPYLARLGINTVSTLFVDWSRNHESCFAEFAQNDIYVIPLLASGSITINGTYPSWNTTIYDTYTTAIDELSQYNNTLGVWAAYETVSAVLNAVNPGKTDAFAAAKAAIRDVKAYIKARNYRNIPVGYAMDDTYSIATLDYLTCGPDSDITDFFGLATYSWCGNSSYTRSHYNQYTKDFSNVTVPSFFAEFGCELEETIPRPWSEVAALYGSNMTQVFSGGIAYEYFNYSNAYGLISIEDNEVTYGADYENLSAQFASATSSPTQSASYTPSATHATTCTPPPPSASFNASNVLPPPPNSLVCDCMMQSLECTVSSSSSILFHFGPEFLANSCKDHPDYCAGIEYDLSRGVYGAYSMCNKQDQYSWYLNSEFVADGRDPKQCGGPNGVLQTPTQPNATCAALLAQAKSDGTGTITSYPVGSTPTAGPGPIGSPTDNQDSGLSTGAKAGIGVGVALGVLLLLGAIVAFFLRKQRKAKLAREKAASDGVYDGKPELGGNGVERSETAMLDGDALPPAERHEVGAGDVSRPVELPAGDGWIGEMGGDERTSLRRGDEGQRVSGR